MKPKSLKTHEKVILAILIGLVMGCISSYLTAHQTTGAGDFRYGLLPARDLWAGKDPYRPYLLDIDPLAVPYPLPAVLLSLPWIALPDRLAAAVFFGLGSSLLSWLILRSKQPWLLFVLLSWPFVNSLIFTQWAPYIVSLYFSPHFLFMGLVKPQLALPFALTQKPSRIGLGIAVSLLLASFVVYPTWPWAWFKTTDKFIGVSPLLVLPWGPLLLLALLNYKEQRAWQLFLFALMPQRMVYDQLPLLLLARTKKQLGFLILCSWTSFAALLAYKGWGNTPGGWQLWILIASYFPALIVVLWPLWHKLFANLKRPAGASAGEQGPASNGEAHGQVDRSDGCAS